jgi:hypothetical protein
VIMYLAPGEPSYLPNGLFGPLQDEAYPDLAPAIRCCSDRQATWDIVAFLAATNQWCPYQDIAGGLRTSSQAVLQPLEALVKSGLIQEHFLVSGPYYRFHAGNRLRSFFILPVYPTTGSYTQEAPVRLDCLPLPF